MPKARAAAMPRPPKHLRPTTAKWFAGVVASYDLEDHHIRLLTLAGEAWDRGQEAREFIAQNGMTFADRFGQPKARPEVGIERDSRIGFARLLRELDIDTEPGDTRPPALRSNRRP